MAVIFFGAAPQKTETFSALGETAQTRTVKVSETVEHLFTHCLIAHPEVAFARNNEYGRHLDTDCLTPYEFKRILKFPLRRRICARRYPQDLSGNGRHGGKMPF